MNHLIVYAHPNPQSFCHAILSTAAGTLREHGHEVMVRDLYAMCFDPLLRRADLQEMSESSLPPEIRTEQFFVRAADVVTFVYPVWWTNMPAMMKGYFDRVFSYNFAYILSDGRPVGLLQGKRVIVFNTQNSSEEAYRSSGMSGAMHKITDEGVFAFSGMEIMEHVFFPEVAGVDALTRESYLGRVRDTMKQFALAAAVT